ncbi:MAG TPA: helix-turn-helix transcriptional regulator [Candidatus Saccharimonadales bacterium]|nr:helix-turn-helix transcriptional regulator [Candidatus Saccharimonadales bacterium]
MTDKTSKYIATQLRQIRLKKDLTQVELARIAGINSNYYAKIERSDLKPSVETLEKIIKALGVKSSDVFPF